MRVLKRFRPALVPSPVEKLNTNGQPLPATAQHFTPPATPTIPVPAGLPARMMPLEFALATRRSREATAIHDALRKR